MLTNAAVKAAQAGDRPYKLADERGLFLFIAPSGLRSWRMKFRLRGKEKLLTFGSYPAMTLTEARARRDDARLDLREGRDPSGARRRAADEAQRAAEGATFAETARRWHAHQLPRWTPTHAGDVIGSLERDVFPAIGERLLGAIDAPAVLHLLRAVEARNCVETARRLRQRISAVFSFAMSEGIASADPSAIVAKALRPIVVKRCHPALLDLDDARGLVIASERVDAGPLTKLASRFLALTATRLAAVRGADWDEFEEVDWTGDFIGPLRPTWRVPAARMKLATAKKADARNAHLVPLSPEAIDVLRAARALQSGSRLVFHGRTPRFALGETAIGQLYNRAGYAGRHVPHGWRATFSTILNERFPAQRSVIDQALAHVAKDKVEAAYNRASHLARRRAIFCAWGGLLMDGLPPARALLTD